MALLHTLSKTTVFWSI